MDNIEEKLSGLEHLIEDKENLTTKEIQNLSDNNDNKNNDEETISSEKSGNTKSPNNSDDKESEKQTALTVNKMSYGQVVETAKKSNLVSTANDKDFVGELSNKNKDVLKASIDLEKEKVEAEKLKIKLEQEKIETEKEKSLNERLKGKFGSKLDEQEYHYKSLKPILETFGIKQAMNVYVMWIIAILGCITLIYPIKLLFCALFGNLIAGASSESRKGFAKGCMWTAIAILGIALTTLIIFGIVKLGQFLF